MRTTVIAVLAACAALASLGAASACAKGEKQQTHASAGQSGSGKDSVKTYFDEASRH